MTLEEMQRRKREFGYSNEKLAELSGVPLGTVQKVMSGSTKSPRQGTLEALARALSRQMEAPVLYPGEMIDGCIRVLTDVSECSENPGAHIQQRKRSIQLRISMLCRRASGRS